MLEVGNHGLSYVESRTHFTLWCMMAAPLIAGNNLHEMKDDITKVLTNSKAIAVDQDAMGVPCFLWTKVNGVEVLEILKKDALTKNIPVVILTSSKEHPDVEKCYGLGVNSYIVKPIVIDDFVKVVADLGLYWVLHNQLPE